MSSSKLEARLIDPSIQAFLARLQRYSSKDALSGPALPASSEDGCHTVSRWLKVKDNEVQEDTGMKDHVSSGHEDDRSRAPTRAWVASRVKEWGMTCWGRSWTCCVKGVRKMTARIRRTRRVESDRVRAGPSTRWTEYEAEMEEYEGDSEREADLRAHREVGFYQANTEFLIDQKGWAATGTTN